jgi:hypothetical protein
MYRRMGYALEYGEIENGMVSLAATSLYCDNASLVPSVSPDQKIGFSWRMQR